MKRIGRIAACMAMLASGACGALSGSRFQSGPYIVSAEDDFGGPSCLSQSAITALNVSVSDDGLVSTTLHLTGPLMVNMPPAPPDHTSWASSDQKLLVAFTNSSDDGNRFAVTIIMDGFNGVTCQTRFVALSSDLAAKILRGEVTRLDDRPDVPGDRA